MFFSAERFTRDICSGQCCFICGVSRAAALFNDEHILPQWILRRFDLYGRTISLPNGRKVRYGSYTIRCCASCNSLLSKELEAPISRMFTGEHNAVVDQLTPERIRQLYIWMATVFLKTHLKDASLKHFANRNDGDATIAAVAGYDWSDFHHIHCIARSAYTKAEISPEVYGTIIVLPAMLGDEDTAFDLIDLSMAQTFAVRIERTVIFAVFNDSCAVATGLSDLIDRINWPLNYMQIRELSAEIACCNLHLINRPVFHTSAESGNPPRVHIYAETEDRPKFQKMDRGLRGAFMAHLFQDILPLLRLGGRTSEESLELLKAGEVTFMEQGVRNFIREA